MSTENEYDQIKKILSKNGYKFLYEKMDKAAYGSTGGEVVTNIGGVIFEIKTSYPEVYLLIRDPAEAYFVRYSEYL